MPSGKVHTLINASVFTAFAGSLGYLHFGLGAPLDLGHLARFSVAFWAGTVLFSPDLDLAEQNVDSKKAWGVLGVIWEPYGRLFSHRGLSHTWLIGPLTRLVYLALIFAPLLLLLGLFLPNLLTLERVPLSLDYWSTTVAGYYLSQWLHLMADGVRPDHDVRYRLRPRSRRFRRRR